MPYADPARSGYCAARHLLRQHANARELRRNPLVVASIDPASVDVDLISAVQARIDRAFHSMDDPASGINARRRTRHAAILLRYDLLRETRSVIARDLGLSLTQFERERRAAILRFLDHFQRISARERARVQTVRSGFARTVCDRAIRLADSGDRQSALTLLDDIVSSAATKEKIRSLICVAEIEASEHAVHRTRAALDSAATLLRGDDVSQEPSRALWFAHEAAGLRLQTVEQGPQEAAQSLVEHPELPRESESVALLVAQAEVLDACGMAKSSGPLLSRAAELIASVPQADAAVGIDLTVLQSQLNFWRDPNAAGRAGLDAAVAAARAAGYAGRAAFTELSQLGGTWASTGDSHARRQYRAVFDRLSRSAEMPRQTRFFAYWDAADVECGLGDPWRAAEAARNALALAPNASRALLMKALLARAYARGQRLGVSERIAREVVQHSAASRSGMAVFSATRTLAYVASATGRTKEAWMYLRDAAEMAPRYGTARIAAELEETLAKFKKRGTPSLSVIFRQKKQAG